LQEEFFFANLSFGSQFEFNPYSSTWFLAHKHLLHSLTFRHAREYSQATHILAPFFLAPTFFDTTLALSTLHLESNGYFPLFLEYYKLDQNLELSSNDFKLTFKCMLHLLINGHFGMVF
jgi:hypothetical protein